MTAAAVLDAPPAAGVFQEIPLGELHESPLNPRRKFEAAALAELAESLRTHGVITPALARPRPLGGYELAAGHRRYRAAKLAGLATLPVIVRELSDVELLEILTVENLQREDVTELEEAHGFRALIDQGGYDVKRIAEKVGKSKEYVYARLKLVELVPAAQAALEKGEMTAGHAILLARLEEGDQGAMLKVLRQEGRYRDGGLSVRELDRRVEEQVREREAQKRAQSALDKLRTAGESPVRIAETWSPEGKDVKGRDHWRAAKKGEKGAIPAVVVESYNRSEIGAVRQVILEKGAVSAAGVERVAADRKRQNAKQRLEAESRRRLWQAVIPKLRDQVLAKDGALADDLQLLVISCTVRRLWNEHAKQLCRLNGWEIEKTKGSYPSWDPAGTILRHLEPMSYAERAAFSLQAALIAHLERGNDYVRGERTDRLAAAARALRIDPAKIEREVAADLKKPATRVQASATPKQRAGDVARARRAKAKKGGRS